MTEAAIRTKERGWIHASRIKGPVDEPKEWTITSEPGDTKLTLNGDWVVMNCHDPNGPRNIPRITPNWEIRPSLYQLFQVLSGQVLRRLRYPPWEEYFHSKQEDQDCFGQRTLVFTP
ncbi:hypothetical protein DUI87_01370 [Hirundo rustica rustica]|uniref:Murine leukemia virus integrase C-terminal domain-containing protein n=1 Tax=Hirundo rustica rustica TaxID=333673 RepID=A0A3M0L4V0_HIRRU|nr:hypothetical protein DUI87_01370 [Hirundo rustica rustica]